MKKRVLLPAIVVGMLLSMNAQAQESKAISNSKAALLARRT